MIFLKVSAFIATNLVIPTMVYSLALNGKIQPMPTGKGIGVLVLKRIVLANVCK